MVMSFMMMMIILSLITLFSPSFWSVWVGMEVMNFVFIPFMMFYQNKSMKSKGFIYLIVGSLSSSLFLLSSFMLNIDSMFILLVAVSMLLKLGAFPFHSWMISISENLDYDVLYIMLTIMKLVPLFILMSLNFLPYMLLIMILGLMISLGGLGSNSIRVVLTYSSISHTSWILMTSMFSEWFMLIYVMIYFSVFYYFIKICKIYNLMKMSNLISWFSKNPLMVFLTASISGMPPFLMFFPKLLCLLGMMKVGLVFEALMCLILSSIPLYFYLKMFLLSFLSESHSSECFFINKNIKFNSAYSLVSLIMINFTLLILLIYGLKEKIPPMFNWLMH
uniref:NADH dehydrogenase subunit 2 n=1 Tax=Plegadiphilus threskiornis TaxID=2965265 RepID=UPI0026E37241|nr:NADH dehydrogenase subunit 2 [Plegadiphilus threskiornis]WIM51535.1 NADH dehydrogenase subunit 2 [Plegadiphilus threskiornis]